MSETYNYIGAICRVTGNPCGTDAHAKGFPCQCDTCRAVECIAEMDAELAEQRRLANPLTKALYRDMFEWNKAMQVELAALRAALRDMVEGMLERGAEIRELRKQLAALLEVKDEH